MKKYRFGMICFFLIFLSSNLFSYFSEDAQLPLSSPFFSGHLEGGASLESLAEFYRVADEILSLNLKFSNTFFPIIHNGGYIAFNHPLGAIRFSYFAESLKTNSSERGADYADFTYQLQMRQQNRIYKNIYGMVEGSLFSQQNFCITNVLNESAGTNEKKLQLITKTGMELKGGTSIAFLRDTLYLNLQSGIFAGIFTNNISQTNGFFVSFSGLAKIDYSFSFFVGFSHPVFVRTSLFVVRDFYDFRFGTSLRVIPFSWLNAGLEIQDQFAEADASFRPFDFFDMTAKIHYNYQLKDIALRMEADLFFSGFGFPVWQ